MCTLDYGLAIRTFLPLPAFLSSYFLRLSLGRNKSGLANTGRCEVLLHSRNRSVGNPSRLFIKRSSLPQQSIILFPRSRSPLFFSAFFENILI